MERLSRLRKIAQARSLPLAAASLAYLTNQPLQTFPIFSCTSVEQLLENMQASDVVFDTLLLRYLEQGDEQRSGEQKAAARKK
jgi:aryl-alcohol dehydrogenase-like predicted oxidoreductase